MRDSFSKIVLCNWKKKINLSPLFQRVDQEGRKGREKQPVPFLLPFLLRKEEV